MNKYSVLAYGIVSYLIGASSLLYIIAFSFNLIPEIGPLHGVDQSEAANIGLALAINVGLLGLFGLQHSVMARPRFKHWLTQKIPAAIERSTYLLATAVVVFALCLGWQSMPQVIWQAEADIAYYSLLAVGLGGWALVFAATFLINHFDLFGLRQVWLYFRGREYTQLPFKLHSLYKWVRHPIMTGVFIGIWFTPVMTVGHLLYALGLSAYILIGVYHEEKDLIKAFGERYLDYRRQTASFFPGFKRKSVPAKTLAA